MQYTDQDIHKALAVVREYDPSTYERMQASDWHVSTDVKDLMDVLTYLHTSQDDMIVIVDQAINSNGSTISRHLETRLLWDFSYFSLKSVRRDCEFDGISSMHMLLACAMVHEFRHTQQPKESAYADEADAFRVEARFEHLLPAPDGPVIVAMVADVRKSELEAVREGIQG